MLPLLLGFGIYQITRDWFPKKSKKPDGIIVGEKLEVAKKDSIALQGLRYYRPEDLHNTSNKFLPISLLTYEEEKRINKFASSANDIGDALLKYVNVIFLDENYKVIGSLIDNKASILEIKPQRKDYKYDRDEVDKSVKYIGYLIAFEDSNNDGKINSQDFHDLYVSNLSGKELRRITKNINVERFEFIKDNSQIFITYTSRKNIREEHKKDKFKIFDLSSFKFLDTSSINKELDKLEKIIIN